MVEAVMEPGSPGVDWSVGRPALQSVLQTVPPNPARIGFYVQNQAAVTVQVVLDHDATGSNYTAVLAGPGGGPGQQGADWSFAQAGIRHTGQIRICGAAGAQVACGEW